MRTLAVLLATLLLLAGCTEEQGSNTDPDQVDSVEAPELGACRMLTPEDVAQPSNATRTVDCCGAAHRADVRRRRPARRARRRGVRRRGARRASPTATCAEKFEKFLGADESLVLRTIVSWAWFRPVGEGLGRGRPLVPLRHRRRRRPERGVRRAPADRRGPAARAGSTTDWLVCADGAERGRGRQGAVHRGAPVAGGHHDQARRAGRPLPGRPGRRGAPPATSAPTRSAPG